MSNRTFLYCFLSRTGHAASTSSVALQETLQKPQSCMIPGGRGHQRVGNCSMSVGSGWDMSAAGSGHSGLRWLTGKLGLVDDQKCTHRSCPFKTVIVSAQYRN